jgi:hypothetical protein
MSDDPPGLGWVTAAEVGGLVLLYAVVVASLLAGGGVLASLSWGLRTALLAFLTVELLVPLWVYRDLRRFPDRASALWVHATVVPVVNLLGLAAYLAERRRWERE